MKTAFILTACLVAFLFCLEVQGHEKGKRNGPPRPPPPPVNGTEDFDNGPRRGKGKGNGPPRPPRPPVNGTEDFDNGPRRGKPFKDYKGVNKTRNFFPVSYNWTIEDENITVIARVNNDSTITVLKPKLEGRGRFKRTSITYDFTNGTHIKIYSSDGPHSSCIVDNTDMTSDEVRNDVAAKDGTTVEITNKESKTVEDDPLSEEEVAALKESNRILLYICRGPFYRFANASGDDQTSNNRTTGVFYDLNNIVTVTNLTPNRGFPGRRPGNGGKGGRGDRKGNGGRSSHD